MIEPHTSKKSMFFTHTAIPITSSATSLHRPCRLILLAVDATARGATFKHSDAPGHPSSCRHARADKVAYLAQVCLPNHRSEFSSLHIELCLAPAGSAFRSLLIGESTGQSNPIRTPLASVTVRVGHRRRDSEWYHPLRTVLSG